MMKTVWVAVIATIALCAGAMAESGERAKSLNPVQFLPAPAGQAVALVKDGAPQATVVIAEKAWKEKSGTEYEAAKELTNCVKLATGAALPIVPDSTNVTGTVILVGESRLTQEKGISATDVPPEGFRVKTFEGGLAIVGRLPDKDGVGPKGTLWGVYDFLERYLGIRWYYPGEDGRIVPPAKDLIVKPVHYTDAPVRIRRIVDGAPSQYRCGTSSAIGIACHTPANLSFHCKEVPECFEMGVDGKRNAGMPCYGNPKTVELMIQDLDNFYAKGEKRPWFHPWFPDGSGGLWGPPTDKVYYISPPDKGVDCCCEYCAKLTDTNAPALGRTSKLVGLFVAKMAAEIQKRWPNVTVHYLPYSNYTLPPDGVVFPNNVVASVCMMHGAANDKEPAVAADNDRIIAGWVKLTGKPVRLWEYVCWPVDDTALPFQYPHVVKAFHQRHRKDVEGSYLNTGYYPQELGKDGMWASQTPTLYCWFRVLWNPDFDVDAALAEYVDLMYGPAGGPMGEIVKTLTDRWEKTRWEDLPAGHHVSPRQINEETMPRAEALKLKDWLAKARELAADGTVYRRRVDFCGKAVEVFLKESENYHEGGKDLPTLAILKVGGNPKLDGQLDDPCWKDAVASPFKMAYDKVNTVPTNGTTVQAVWTDAGVTFGFKLTEPEVDKIKATCTRHDQDVYGDDCIEIFLDVSGQRKKYYQIVANALGAIYDGTAEGRDWDATGAKAVAYKGEGFWSLEVFVPFSDFPETAAVKIGSVWYANIMRSRYREKMEIQRWSTLYRPSNHDFSAFGKLRFVE